MPPPVNAAGGKRFVIADIHGSARTLQTLVEEKIRLTRADQLFLLGDYIDRGSRNARVLDFILNLQATGYQVYPLRGNHEQMLLDAWSRHSVQAASSTRQKPFNIEAADLLDRSGQLSDRYITFLVSLPWYFELDHFYLVHAGFDFSKPNPFEDHQSMLWMRNFRNNTTSKIVVHGHEVTGLRQIVSSIENGSPIIPLDNGCFQGTGLRRIKSKNPEIDLGNLCALDLHSGQLLVQENID